MELKLVRFKNPLGHELPVLADEHGEILHGQRNVEVVNNATGVSFVRAEFILVPPGYPASVRGVKEVGKGVIEALDEVGHS